MPSNTYVYELWNDKEPC